MDNPKKKQTKSYTYETSKILGVALEMGFIIALPIVALGSAGKWLDARYHTSFLVYIAIVISLLISGTWLYKRVSELARKLTDASKSQEKPQSKMDSENRNSKTDNFEEK